MNEHVSDGESAGMQGQLLSQLTSRPTPVYRAGGTIDGESFYNRRDLPDEFVGTTITNTGFILCDIAGTSFTGATLKDVVFSNSDLAGIDFIGARLSNVEFTSSNLDDADLAGATLENCTINGCTVNSGDFTGARVVDTAFMGSEMTAAMFSGTLFSGAGTDFSECNLIGADFSRSKFCDVRPAVLYRNQVENVILTGCDLDLEVLTLTETQRRNLLPA